MHQAGSLVEPDKLRFDFTNFSVISAEDLDRISRIVNDEILKGDAVTTQVLPIAEAKKLGAIAMFGEKYGDIVRVVRMGEGKDTFSMEFCGGTHLDNTAKVGPFHIKSEASIASGVRRIEATVGKESIELMNNSIMLLSHLADVFKVCPADVAEKAEQAMEKRV